MSKIIGTPGSPPAWASAAVGTASTGDSANTRRAPAKRSAAFAELPPSDRRRTAPRIAVAPRLAQEIAAFAAEEQVDLLHLDLERLPDLMAELHRLMGNVPPLPSPPASPQHARHPAPTPVIDKLAATSTRKIEQWLTDLQALGVQPDARFVNGILASTAYKVVRAHFKRRYKSSNKRYAASADRWPERQPRAQHLLEPLITGKRPLDDRLALGVGNCSEMASAVATLIKRCGMPARVWASLDRARSILTHEFALIGASTIPHSADHFHGRDDLWIADPWAGICCPAPDYAQEFHDKMHRWAALGKEVYHEGAWMPANDPRWLRAVVHAEMVPFQMTPVDDPLG